MADVARASARGAGLDLRPGLRAGAAADVAALHPRELDGPLDAGRGLFKGDLDVVAEVVSALRHCTSARPGARAAERHVEDIAEARSPETGAGVGSRTAVQSLMAEAIVHLALVAIAENLVRLVYLLDVAVRARVL